MQQNPTIDLIKTATKLAGMSETDKAGYIAAMKSHEQPTSDPLSTTKHPTYDKVVDLVDLKNLAQTLGLQTAIGETALLVALQNVVTLDKKQQDYGPKNISKHGIRGVLVRIDDKLSRIENLYENEREGVNESLEDSFLDLSNYALICVLLLRNQWPRS